MKLPLVVETEFPFPADVLAIVGLDTELGVVLGEEPLKKIFEQELGAAAGQDEMSDRDRDGFKIRITRKQQPGGYLCQSST